MKYLPRIDSLRFFAVFAVILSHWLGSNFIVKKLPLLGYYGVSFFFVLSGFLITRILWQQRDVKKSLFNKLKNFFAKRAIRIFPIYYLSIFFFLFTIPAIFENNFVYFFTYLSNFLTFFSSKWPDMLSHFWSLAVEEQFYLFWPFIILLMKKDLFLKINFLIIIFSVLFKSYFNYYASQNISYYSLLPFSQLDLFAIGAILAFKYDTFVLELDKFKRYKLLIFLILIVSINLISPRLIIIQNVFFGILSCIIILLSDRRLNLYLFKILDQKFLIFLGKISYGLYVYHNFIPWLIRNLNGTEIRYQLNFKYSILPNDINPIIWFLLSILLLITISSISWFFIEKPILKLKSKFNT